MKPFALPGDVVFVVLAPKDDPNPHWETEEVVIKAVTLTEHGTTYIAKPTHPASLWPVGKWCDHDACWTFEERELYRTFAAAEDSADEGNRKAA